MEEEHNESLKQVLKSTLTFTQHPVLEKLKDCLVCLCACVYECVRIYFLPPTVVDFLLFFC